MARQHLSISLKAIKMDWLKNQPNHFLLVKKPLDFDLVDSNNLATIEIDQKGVIETCWPPAGRKTD